MYGAMPLLSHMPSWYTQRQSYIYPLFQLCSVNYLEDFCDVMIYCSQLCLGFCRRNF